MTNEWKVRTLGDLCDVVGGGTPPKDTPSYYSGNIPWATVRDMRQEFLTETECRITNAAVHSSATKIIPSGNVIIATRVGLGKVCMLGQDTAINQDLRGIIPRDSSTLTARFLFWWLKAHSDLIVAEGTGATVQGVKLPFIKSLKIPVPSRLEQERIVRTLDEAFEGIATAKVNAERNMHNASALYESYLQSVFSQQGPGWVARPLGRLATFRNGINYTQQSKGEQIKIVGVRNFQNNFTAPLDELDSVMIDGTLRDEDSLKEDDILVVRSNGNIELIGRCLLVGKVTEKITHSGFTIRIRLTLSDLLPRYLCHFMKTATSRKRMADGGTGTNIKSLNQATLSSLAISFPPLLAQKQLVDRLESMSAHIRHLEALYHKKLGAWELVKTSLLHQAFTGRL